MLRACASDSITQGPAMTKSCPPPTCTGPISKELLTNLIVAAPEAHNRLECAAVSGIHFLRPFFRSRYLGAMSYMQGAWPAVVKPIAYPCEQHSAEAPSGVS